LTTNLSEETEAVDLWMGSQRREERDGDLVKGVARHSYGQVCLKIMVCGQSGIALQTWVKVFEDSQQTERQSDILFI
jgi:hypothetical protein